MLYSVPHLSIFHVCGCIPGIWSWLAKVGNEQITLTFSDFWFGEYTCSSGHLIYEAETMEQVSRL